MLKFNEYLINKDKITFVKFLQITRRDNGELTYKIEVHLLDGYALTHYTADKSEIEKWQKYFENNV